MVANITFLFSKKGYIYHSSTGRVLLYLSTSQVWMRNQHLAGNLVEKLTFFLFFFSMHTSGKQRKFFLYGLDFLNYSFWNNCVFVINYSWIQHILAENIFITAKPIYNLEVWKSPIPADVPTHSLNLEISLVNTFFVPFKTISVIPLITLQCACENCKQSGAGLIERTMTRLEDAVGFSRVCPAHSL